MGGKELVGMELSMQPSSKQWVTAVCSARLILYTLSAFASAPSSHVSHGPFAEGPKCKRHMEFAGSGNYSRSSHAGCSTQSCRHLVSQGAGNKVEIQSLLIFSWPSYLRFSGVTTRGLSELGNELPRNSALLAQVMMLKLLHIAVWQHKFILSSSNVFPKKSLLLCSWHRQEKPKALINFGLIFHWLKYVGLAAIITAWKTTSVRYVLASWH